MTKPIYSLLMRVLFVVAILLLQCGCASQQLQNTPRFFWPPPPGEAKIEYLNYYFSDEDLLRGVDRRLEHAILGKRNIERLVSQPYSVASDGKGRIFVGDFTHKYVAVLDRSAHVARQLAPMLGAAQKVLVDNKGEIWALDGKNVMIYHFTADEKLVAELKLVEISRAASLAVDSDRQRIYLSEPTKHRICVFDYAGTMLTSFGTRGRDGGQFNYPTDLDLDAAGNLYVLDSMNARVQVLSGEGLHLRTFGERGTASGSFSTPKGLAVSPSGIVYVTDANQNRVVIFNTNGDYLLTLGGRDVYDGKNIRPGGFYFPTGVDVDANDTIFVADFFNGMIHEFQYLTPAYLAERPIRPADVVKPQPADFKGGGNDVGLPPVTPPGGAEQTAPVLKPL